MEKYQVRFRRQGWAIITLTINGTEKTIRRFKTKEEAEEWKRKQDIKN